MKSSKTAALSTHYAARLIFFSFYFSQGNTNLQRGILRWLSGSLVESSIDSNQLVDIYQSLSRMVLRYIGKKTKGTLQRHKDVVGIEGQCKLWISIAMELFSPNRATGVYRCSDQIPFIVAWMIETDARHMFYGRPRDGNLSEHPMADSQLSHLCHYGVCGKPSGIQAYDTLFREVAEYLRSHDWSGTHQLEEANKLKWIIEAHNRSHPADAIFIDQINLTLL